MSVYGATHPLSLHHAQINICISAAPCHVSFFVAIKLHYKCFIYFSPKTLTSFNFVMHDPNIETLNHLVESNTLNLRRATTRFFCMKHISDEMETYRSIRVNPKAPTTVRFRSLPQRSVLRPGIAFSFPCFASSRRVNSPAHAIR